MALDVDCFSLVLHFKMYILKQTIMPQLPTLLEICIIKKLIDINVNVQRGLYLC